jgi:hypothetical protein
MVCGKPETICCHCDVTVGGEPETICCHCDVTVGGEPETIYRALVATRVARWWRIEVQ